MDFINFDNKWNLALYSAMQDASNARILWSKLRNSKIFSETDKVRKPWQNQTFD